MVTYSGPEADSPQRIDEHCREMRRPQSHATWKHKWKQNLWVYWGWLGPFGCGRFFMIRLWRGGG
jgi:hypothetical protein